MKPPKYRSTRKAYLVKDLPEKWIKALEESGCPTCNKVDNMFCSNPFHLDN